MKTLDVWKARKRHPEIGLAWSRPKIFRSADRNAGKASQRLEAMGLAAGLPSPPRGVRDFKVLSIGILLLCALPLVHSSCVIAPDANGHVDYPAGETSMGSSAFDGCTSLVSITLPSSLTSISSNAFIRCTSLVNITLPSSLTSISMNVFYGCTSLVSISLPAGLTSLPTNTFRDCTSLVSITLPSSLTLISRYVFFGCSSLVSITLPSSLTTIRESAFRDCTSLASIILPSSLQTVGDYAFNGCSNLSVVRVPDGCTVGALAFYGTAAPAPGYLVGLPPTPPLPPPLPPPPATYFCGPGTTGNAASGQCEIACDGNGDRRLADAGVDVGVGTDAEVATSDAVVDAYLREHPELAAQVDKEMMMHFRRFVERFGVPALA